RNADWWLLMLDWPSALCDAWSTSGSPRHRVASRVSSWLSEGGGLRYGELTRLETWLCRVWNSWEIRVSGLPRHRKARLPDGLHSDGWQTNYAGYFTPRLCGVLGFFQAQGHLDQLGKLIGLVPLVHPLVEAGVPEFHLQRLDVFCQHKGMFLFISVHFGEQRTLAQHQ